MAFPFKTSLGDNEFEDCTEESLERKEFLVEIMRLGPEK
jgi:hypothetical protein